MYFIEMLLAFLVLTGVVLFFRSLMKVNMGEGMLLGASAVVLFLYLGSRAGTFAYGFYAVCAVSAVGMALWLWEMAVRFRRPETVSGETAAGVSVKKKWWNAGAGQDAYPPVFSPVFLGLLFLYLFFMVILYNDFIQHIDELHHWAAAVKYMLGRDRMPTGSDFLGGGGNYAFATSLFHLFFQKFTGYSEQGMYVSASLLMWIGFLLPFSGCERKDWKKIAVYTGIMYVALFTLYAQGSKSLYVDLPVAAWAGGLVGWWTSRSGRKSDYAVAFSGLVMLHFFKASSGLLMALFVLVFMVLYTWLIESGRIEGEKAVKRMVCCAAVMYTLVIAGSVMLLGAAASIRPYEPEQISAAEHADTGDAEENAGQSEPVRWELAGVKLPDYCSDMINIVRLSRDKIKKTVSAFISKSFGDPLAPRSNWSVGFLPIVFLMLILLKAAGDINGERRKSVFYMLYAVFTVLAYSAALFFSYLFMFAYELSIDLRSSRRYFSACCIFLFILALTELLRGTKQQGRARELARSYVLAAVALFFLLGVNEKFIPNVTALDKENTSGYEKLNSTKKQIEKINSVIDENDRVYYICQYTKEELSGAELFNSSALYYLEPQVSNYLAEPWRFTEDGSNIRLEDYDISIENLPALLAQGGYTHVWILKADDYLKKNLPQVLECDTIANKRLYEVEYADGVPVGLELVKKL